MSGTNIYCDACGYPNRPQASFCFECGQRLPVPGAAPSAVAPTGSMTPRNLLSGHYHITSLAGQGGMGAVYKATDSRLGGRTVAVKEMSQSGLSPQEIAEAEDAFRREMLTLANLSHPSLPRIYDYFTEGGRWYLVMEYIEGETLEAVLRRVGGHPLPLATTLDYADQLCAVLSYLHTHVPPIIFRDLKPANIIMGPNQRVFLIDFGIARLFKPGQARDTVAMGSPGYAAPEQYGKAQTTVRSDIYSLGATLHQCLTGSDPSANPFRFASPRVQNPQVPPSLDGLIMCMVAMDPAHRPITIAEVQRELQVASHPAPTPTP